MEGSSDGIVPDTIAKQSREFEHGNSADRQEQEWKNSKKKKNYKKMSRTIKEEPANLIEKEKPKINSNSLYGFNYSS